MSRTQTATRPLYVVAGATDLAVELARGYVAEAQAKVTGAQKKATERVQSVDLEPKALQDKATGLVNARVEEIASRAKARRDAVEKQVTDLQAQAKALPGKVESYAKGTYADLEETYSELAVRGEKVVSRIRRQQATQDLTEQADATASKVKAARTTAKKSATSTRNAAKKSAERTRATAEASAERTRTTAEAGAERTRATAEAGAKRTRSTAEAGAKRTRTSVKAASTSVKKTAEKAVKAVDDAADKVGDGANGAQNAG